MPRKSRRARFDQVSRAPREALTDARKRSLVRETSRPYRAESLRDANTKTGGKFKRRYQPNRETLRNWGSR